MPIGIDEYVDHLEGIKKEMNARIKRLTNYFSKCKDYKELIETNRLLDDTIEAREKLDKELKRVKE